MVIAIANQKGGVLKTTSTYNLGYCLAKNDKRVLMIDFDPQASLTISVGHEPTDFEYTICDILEKRSPIGIEKCIYNLSENLDFVPTSLDFAAMEMEIISRTAREYLLTKALEPIRTQYDYILIDCPPQLSILTVNALTAADRVIIPCKTDYLSYRGLDQLHNTVNEVKSLVNPKIEIMGVIPTLFEKRTNDHKEVLSMMEKKYKILGVISRTTIATKGVYDGMSAAEKNPSAEISLVYAEIAKKIIEEIEK